MIIALYIVLGLLFLYILLGFSATLYMLCPPKVTAKKKDEELLVLKQVNPSLFKIPFEKVWLKSPFGYNIYARKYSVTGSNKYVLLLHGHNSDSSAMVRFADLFLKRGINCIIPDHRYSALSGGKCITFGHKEKQDAAVFIEYIHSLDKDAQIGIFGESMGAGTALLLSENRKDLRFCIEYCGFSDLSSVLKYILRSIWKPFVVLYPIISLFLPIFTSTSVKNISPASAAKNIYCPILVMHSKADKVVPFESSITISKNIAKPTVVTFEKAQHGLSLNTYPKEFEGAVNSFLDFISF